MASCSPLKNRAWGRQARRHDNVVVTSKNVATLFWRNNDAIITPHGRWDSVQWTHVFTDDTVWELLIFLYVYSKTSSVNESESATTINHRFFSPWNTNQIDVKFRDLIDSTYWTESGDRGTIVQGRVAGQLDRWGNKPLAFTVDGTCIDCFMQLSFSHTHCCLCNALPPAGAQKLQWVWNRLWTFALDCIPTQPGSVSSITWLAFDILTALVKHGTSYLQLSWWLGGKSLQHMFGDDDIREAPGK